MGHQTPTTIPRTSTEPHLTRQPTTQQNPQTHPPHAPTPHLQRCHVAHISADARRRHLPTSQGAEQSTNKGRATITHAIHHQPHHQTRHAQKTSVGLPRPTTPVGGGMEQSSQQPITSHTHTNPQRHDIRPLPRNDHPRSTTTGTERPKPGHTATTDPHSPHG